MLRHSFILILVFMGFRIIAQNLIPNPGFDQKNACPKQSGQISLANFWFCPNQTTPDYFNECSTSLDFGTEFNKKGGQLPHSGHAYAGIQVYNMNHNEYFEYLSTPLDSALIAGQQYCVSAWVSLGDSKYALKELGVVFSVNELKSASPKKIKIPYLSLRNIKPLSDSERWICIRGVYRAKGGERFLTFGDFSENDNFISLQYGNAADTLFKSAYYFVDDISVELIKDSGGCNNDVPGE